jgi:two-component SAPR family response regulator
MKYTQECSESVVIRLYGFPKVENVNGDEAMFRKSRALELLVWLSLNKERPRRSAARTALWEYAISDATFCTVISDMRRGLQELSPRKSSTDWFRPTYTDAISIDTHLVTDADLITQHLENFRRNPATWRDLADVLMTIRDAPFAGTEFSWADLDGSTTRLTILAIEASSELAKWARDNGDTSLALRATSAGLKVLPGCEELLEIEQSFLPAVSTSRSRRFG